MAGHTDYSNNRIPSAGIYIHIPYCIRKCRYCDFVSFERPPEDGYFAKLAEDMKASKNTVGNGSLHYVDTVFFGGGTPSLAGRAQLAAVLGALRESFEIMDGAEISIEVNPETVTEQKAAELKELGFTRVSMGVQSFDDAVLKAIGRIHSADRARQAFSLRAAFTSTVRRGARGIETSAASVGSTSNFHPWSANIFARLGDFDANIVIILPVS